MRLLGKLGLELTGMQKDNNGGYVFTSSEVCKCRWPKIVKNEYMKSSTVDITIQSSEKADFTNFDFKYPVNLKIEDSEQICLSGVKGLRKVEFTSDKFISYGGSMEEVIGHVSGKYGIGKDYQNVQIKEAVNLKKVDIEHGSLNVSGSAVRKENINAPNASVVVLADGSNISPNQKMNYPKI